MTFHFKNPVHISVVALFVFSIQLQLSLPIRGDVSYLLYVTDLMLSGGTYGNDFSETNPPMILYLYTPVILASKIIPLTLTTLVRLYVFGLASASIYISYQLSGKIISRSPARLSLLYGLMVALLILPFNQFGQREHLFLILFMPYLLSIGCLLVNKKIRPDLLTGICIAAALGLCMKPYFLCVFVMANLLVVIKKHRLSACLTPSFFLIVFILCFYLISTYVLFPNYFTIILPLVNQFYFPAITEPWIYIFINPSVLFCMAVLVSYFMFRKQIHQYTLGDLLAFGLIGAMLAFLVTRTSWFYHTLPAFSIACILLIFLLGQFIHESLKHHKLFNVLAISLLCTPVITILFNQLKPSEHNEDYFALTSYIEKAPGERSVSCFSVNTTAVCFPLVVDTQSSYGNRYPFFWWMRGLVFFPDKQGYQLLINTVAEDLNDYKPHWIIVNTKIPKYFFGEGFDLITFFSGNEAFKKAWNPYELVKEAGAYQLYERKVR